MEKEQAVRRAVAEATGWKVVNPPEYGGMWYSIDPNGQYHLIPEAINSVDIEDAWKWLCNSFFTPLPKYHKRLDDIWPLFKKHGLTRKGLVMSSFLHSEPKEAAFRLCEIFLELIEEQKEAIPNG